MVDSERRRLTRLLGLAAIAPAGSALAAAGAAGGTPPLVDGSSDWLGELRRQLRLVGLPADACSTLRAPARRALETAGLGGDPAPLLRLQWEAWRVSTMPFEHWFRCRCREDFTAGRIIVVNGWHLSFTEATLYAGVDGPSA